MKEGGVWSMVVGLIVVIVSFFLETTYGDSYNTGLLQKQQNILFVGLCLYLTGIILLCAGYIFEQIEKVIGTKTEGTVFDANKKAIKVGSYLVCPKCNKSNPSDFKKCRYCDTVLVVSESKANFSKAQ